MIKNGQNSSPLHTPYWKCLKQKKKYIKVQNSIVEQMCILETEERTTESVIKKPSNRKDEQRKKGTRSMYIYVYFKVRKKLRK